ncbi:Fic family protein [Microbacterium sp.]|uniref:Fic family protein n=1 Tax=Microbacterium sp. TaxID=51671 RepID=UPI0039E2D22B
MGGTWQAVGYESRPWPRGGEISASRRQLRRIHRDYRAAVPPLIADAPAVLEPEVLAAAEDASAELVRFDAEAGPVAPVFAAILLRTESASSSEVENLTARAKEVALAEIGRARSGNAKLIIANVRAMTAALQADQDLDESAVIAIQRELLGESAPHMTGAWRQEQVWIGGTRYSPHDAQFVPPHHERVPALMADLFEFIARTDVPVLPQAAIAHAQFETIHPFPDGNGRTGRALLHLMLRRSGLTRQTTVPISAGLLHDPQKYFDALTDYREGDVDAIVHAMTDAAFAAVSHGRRLISDIAAIREMWREEVTARSDATVHRLLDLLPTHPVITANTAADALRVSTAAVGGALAALVDLGILTKAAGGERYRVWQAPAILTALDEFAARARRGRL